MNHRPAARLGRAILLAIAAASIAAGSVSANGPDPLAGGRLWTAGQAVTYQWRAGQVPPAWMAAAIDRAATDINVSRGSRAATFSRVGSGATSLISYGEPSCAPAGLACYDRTGAPASFRMAFRAHGYVFDWGVLRWCEGLAVVANGCFDAETIALDEFGHVEGLEHHANLANGADYGDAVVQTVSRSRPMAYWQTHALGRCDVARLQLEYDRMTPAFPFSTCLSIPTAAVLSAPGASRWVGDTVVVTATLTTTASAANRALASDPVSARTVLLQRRVIGTTAWITVGAMSQTAGIEGSYVMLVAPTATYEWSARFVPAANDGALASTTQVVTILVGGCSGRICPLSPGAR